MTVAESARCRCEHPDPHGAFVFGLQLCLHCGRVANWRDFEDDTDEP